MKKTLLHTLIQALAMSTLLYTAVLNAQNSSEQGYTAYDLRAERIRLINDAVKITWKMDTRHTGDFVLGRSEQ